MELKGMAKVMLMSLGSRGDIEVFKAAQRATPISYVAGTQVATNYNATFYCTQAQMALLAEHGFSVASIKLGDETVTRVVKEKKADKTQNNARCIIGD